MVCRGAGMPLCFFFVGYFFPAEGVVEDVEDAEEEEGIACPCEVTVVFLYFVEEHVGG